MPNNLIIASIPINGEVFNIWDAVRLIIQRVSGGTMAYYYIDLIIKGDFDYVRSGDIVDQLQNYKLAIKKFNELKAFI